MNEHQNSSTLGRRVRTGAITWVAVLVVLRILVLQPERCGDVSEDEVRASATAAVEWLVVNQLPDGRWLYRYDAVADEDLGGYNNSRHSGVTYSLYSAALAGIPGALESADEGAKWLVDRLVEAGGGLAMADPGAATVPIGGSALGALALSERRLLAGDDRYDEELRALGRFLQSQIEPNGAVAERWNAVTDRPVAGVYSPFFTGEAYFALSRLERLFPGEGWGESADLIGHYLATARDEVEDWFPAVSDHWAAYGLAETTEWRPLTDDEIAYAETLGGIFGPQIRYASQRTESWFTHRTRGRQTLGAGLGTLGEGTTGLWTVATREERAARLTEPAAERSHCVAGLLVERQIDATEAGGFDDPSRAFGAWFQFGVTQMDDQQHPLSALLRTLPILEGTT
ncbi:MAG: hypothetical protein KJP22_04480 [Acidimicrobiia bacterium]|nr:hypothetical protein [Acidimicrobiia bacterium]NNF89707.1 hypothetical protein [Acidimicrobiia bacterium]